MLAWLGVELALAIERAAGAFQIKIGALAPGELCFRSGITCHANNPFIKRLAQARF
jgi:hypothetical protein